MRQDDYFRREGLPRRLLCQQPPREPVTHTEATARTAPATDSDEETPTLIQEPETARALDPSGSLDAATASNPVPDPFPAESCTNCRRVLPPAPNPAPPSFVLPSATAPVCVTDAAFCSTDCFWSHNLARGASSKRSSCAHLNRRRPTHDSCTTNTPSTNSSNPPDKPPHGQQRHKGRREISGAPPADRMPEWEIVPHEEEILPQGRRKTFRGDIRFSVSTTSAESSACGGYAKAEREPGACVNAMFEYDMMSHEAGERAGW